VYRAVCAIGLEWKVIGPWALHARPKERVQNDEELGDHPQVVMEPEKLGLQLYKVKEGKFLLDIKLLQGDTFVFFDFCSRLLGEIRLG
jgi:5'-AMP-activated protein kinase, catalytic alpha subunit